MFNVSLTLQKFRRATSGKPMTVAKFKEGFFDRPAILNAMDNLSKKALSQYGAFVRQRAKSSIKIKRGSSTPGRPPHGHKTARFKKTNRRTMVTRVQASSPLRELIYFAYDQARRSVVVGPAYYARRSPAAPGVGMELLEYGGQSSVLMFGKRKSGRYKARPFMRPAAAAERGNLPGLWANGLRR